MPPPELAGGYNEKGRTEASRAKRALAVLFPSELTPGGMVVHEVFPVGRDKIRRSKISSYVKTY